MFKFSATCSKFRLYHLLILGCCWLALHSVALQAQQPPKNQEGVSAVPRKYYTDPKKKIQRADDGVDEKPKQVSKEPVDKKAKDNKGPNIDHVGFWASVGRLISVLIFWH